MTARITGPRSSAGDPIVRLAESGRLPDPVVRAAVRRVIGRSLRRAARIPADRRAAFVASLGERPLRPGPRAVDGEGLPASFFELLLGPRLLYSSAYWTSGVTDLGGAEEAVLGLITERAQIDDGQEILDLGCGWGALSLWLAAHYPGSRVLAVSNLATETAYVEKRAAALGVGNLVVETADLGEFDTNRRFDRVLSIETLEHVGNQPELLTRLRGWLAPGGMLFLDHASHHRFTYPFEMPGGRGVERFFMVGPIMPSHDLSTRFDESFRHVADWWIDGTHYARSLEAWLTNLDQHRQLATRRLAGLYGDAADRWLNRWRLSLMASAEMFGFNGGGEWGMSHHLLIPS